jgi:hypothetical protein
MAFIRCQVTSAMRGEARRAESRSIGPVRPNPYPQRERTMEKIEKDGRVAVLYSPGFGAGWSTWAYDDQKEALCMDARIVGPFVAGDKVGAVAAAVAMFPDFYTGGASGLSVMWIEKGKAFEVNEYDGNESVHVLGDRTYLVA